MAEKRLLPEHEHDAKAEPKEHAKCFFPLAVRVAASVSATAVQQGKELSGDGLHGRGMLPAMRMPAEKF
eukprot:127397-Rhodomonas_salina.3